MVREGHEEFQNNNVPVKTFRPECVSQTAGRSDVDDILTLPFCHKAGKRATSGKKHIDNYHTGDTRSMTRTRPRHLSQE